MKRRSVQSRNLRTIVAAALGALLWVAATSGRAADPPLPSNEVPTPEHVGAEARLVAQWNEARALAKQEQYAAAVRNYIHVFNYSRSVATLALARLAVLPAEVVALAEKFPVAEQALREEIRIRAGLILTDVAGTDEILEFVALNRALGEPQRIVQMYDQLKGMGERARAMRLRMRDVIGEELIDAGRAAELGDAVLVHARNILLRIASLEADLGLPRGEAAAAYLDALGASAVTDGARIHGVLLATQRDAAAARLAGRLTAFAPRVETWEALIRSAVTQNRPDVARRLADDAQARLDEDDGKRLRDVLR